MVTREMPAEPEALFAGFYEELSRSDARQKIADGLIGADAQLDGPFGRKPVIYADYVASGRALMQIERLILEHILPYYANSHTEASFCGSYMTRLRREARRIAAGACGADARHAVIFCGSGATAGVNRLVNLLGTTAAVRAGQTPCVLIGPYEHHSNILAWRESGAKVIELPEAESGGPDLQALDNALAKHRNHALVVGSFSAASNVTGIQTDVAEITARLNRAGALSVWDYAGGGPYLPISMTPGANAAIDAIVLSPHKFIGGPGASGLLIMRKDRAVSQSPTWPGGGTVKFVSRQQHVYSDDLATREEAGTPNVIGDIRVALAFLAKQAIGEENIVQRNRELVERATDRWREVQNLELLGNPQVERLPIFSFRIRDNKGGYVHHQLITRMLSDRFGIQARGGCACAGPYVMRLLCIDDAQSEAILQSIAEGDEMSKPGFTRLNFSVLLNNEKVDYILDSVVQLASDAAFYANRYECDPDRAIFTPKCIQSEAAQ
jgi:selenocysteine lyase/cysteine desulfurase